MIKKYKKGQFVKRLFPTREWLYKKYVVERLSWKELYSQYGISYCLIGRRLKEFNLKRPRKAWNSGKNKLIDTRLNYFRPTVFRDYGLTSINMKIRKSLKYRIWRTAVFERDNYACIWCGFKGYLEADHIKSFALYPLLRFDINNGRTLCKPCHLLTDNYGRKAITNYYGSIVGQNLG